MKEHFKIQLDSLNNKNFEKTMDELKTKMKNIIIKLNDKSTNENTLSEENWKTLLENITAENVTLLHFGKNSPSNIPLLNPSIINTLEKNKITFIMEDPESLFLTPYQKPAYDFPSPTSDCNNDINTNDTKPLIHIGTREMDAGSLMYIFSQILDNKKAFDFWETLNEDHKKFLLQKVNTVETLKTALNVDHSPLPSNAKVDLLKMVQKNEKNKLVTLTSPNTSSDENFFGYFLKPQTCIEKEEEFWLQNPRLYIKNLTDLDVLIIMQGTGNYSFSPSLYKLAEKVSFGALQTRVKEDRTRLFRKLWS